MELTAAERSLIMRYGYPFEKIEREPAACSASMRVEVVPLDRFELGQLIGDLCRSINDMKRCATLDRLVELCDRLERAERYGDGRLDAI
jgi:hypothetical protein